MVFVVAVNIIVFCLWLLLLFTLCDFMYVCMLCVLA